MDTLNPIRADFKRIVNIFVNIKGTVSIVIEDKNHDTYLLEIEGTVTPMHDTLHRTKKEERE